MAHVSKSSDHEKLVSRFDKIAPRGERLFVAVYCNYCERIETGMNIDELMEKIVGWRIGDAGELDFCPKCRVDSGWAGSFPKPR